MMKYEVKSSRGLTVRA